MSDYSNIQGQLDAGFQALGLSLPSKVFLQYLLLLKKWNHAYNLTAVRDMDVMVERHILDSLAICPWIKGPRVLDVGTGAGFPGIPLALAMPQLQVTLLDSNGKKVRFLKEVKRALSLDNVNIIQSRVESYRESPGFDTVTSRAFSDLAQMTHWTQHLVAPNGIWVAMKGRYPEVELSQIQSPYRVETYMAADQLSERCCVIIDNVIKE